MAWRRLVKDIGWLLGCVLVVLALGGMMGLVFSMESAGKHDDCVNLGHDTHLPTRFDHESEQCFIRYHGEWMTKKRWEEG